MLCIVAFIVFSILGIFSATHRALAKEAMGCVFRRITLRPCDTGFKEKIKSGVVARVAAKSTWLARIINRHSEVFSWIFFILMVWSTVWVIRGGVNFYLYGSCNGLNSSGFCVFDPTGENNKITAISGEGCSIKPKDEKNLTAESLSLSDYPYKSAEGAKDNLIFIGCYACDYTRKAYPQIQSMLKSKPINYSFIHFSVKPETNYLTNYDYCANKMDPEKFWAFNDSLFQSTIADIDKPEYAQKLVSQAGYDLSPFMTCVNDPATTKAVEAQKAEILKTGIYGTPTIFINGKSFVGPKPDRVYRRALKGIWW